MKMKRFLALLLALVMMLSLVVPVSADQEDDVVIPDEQEQTVTLDAAAQPADEAEQPETQPETAAPQPAAPQPTPAGKAPVAAAKGDTVPACDCGNATAALISHADTCARKAYFRQLATDCTAAELYAQWNTFSEDEQTYLLQYLQWNDWQFNGKYAQLQDLIAGAAQEEKTATVADGTTVSIGNEYPDAVLSVSMTDAAKAPAAVSSLGLSGGTAHAYNIDVTGADGPVAVRMNIPGFDPNTQTLRIYHILDTVDAAYNGLLNGDAYITSVSAGDSSAFSKEISVAQTVAEKLSMASEISENSICVDRITDLTVDADGNIVFDTDSFSDFLIYTVDFHNGDVTFSIPVGTDVLLSEIFSQIGYLRDAASATDVWFSNSDLLTATRQQVGDWLLSSLVPFNTDETLYVKFSDDEIVEIYTTDAVTVTTAKELVNAITKGTDDIFIGANITWNMSGNYTIKKQIYIQNGYTLTINPNGTKRTITRGFKNNPLFVITNGTLTINGTATYPITIDGNKQTVSGISGHLIGVQNANGKLNLTYCTLKDNYTSASNGGAISNAGTATLNNCTITNCQANSTNDTYAKAGAIYNEGTLTLNNTKISSCSAKFEGGAIKNVGTVTMTNGSITSCSARAGGAIHSDGTVTLKGVTIDSNTASGGGGAIVTTKTLKLDGSTENKITNNTCGENGGAILVGSAATLTMTGTNTITGNKSTVATGLGGGIYMNGTMNVKGTANISSNTVKGTTNNVYLNGDKTITVTGAINSGSNIGVTKDSETSSVGIAKGNASTTITGGAQRITSGGHAQFFNDDYDTIGKTRHRHLDKAAAGNTLYFCTCDHTVKFNANGGSVSPTSKSTTDEGNVVNSFPTPTRTGYTFNGWYTEKTGGTKTTSKDFKDAGRTNTSITLYAQWTINQYTVKGTIDHGGTVTNGSQTVNYNGTSTAMLFTPAAGYKIKSITVNGTAQAVSSTSSYTYPAKMITGNHTVAVTTEPIGYTITYDANGGTGAPDAQDYNITTNVKLSGTKPTRAGYTFSGWKLDSAVNNWAAGNYSDSQAIGTGKYGNITLKAQWTENDVTIKYVSKDTNMGTVSPASEMIKAATGTAQGSTATAKTGYKFVGWYSDEACTNQVGTNAKYVPGKNSGIYAEATYYAKFAPQYKYNLNFDGNGNTSGTVPAAQTAGWIDDTTKSFTIPTCDIARTGYTFQGWATTANATTAQYQPGQSYSLTGIPAQEVSRTLYAVWKINTSSLKVDPNGGTWNGNTTVQTYTENYNTTKEIPVPTRAGYTFKGWTQNITNGSMTSATADATYTFGPTDGATDTITAQWEKDLGSLTITKRGAAAVDANQSFIFHVVSKSLNDPNGKTTDMYVTVQGNNSVTVKDLPTGIYTVEEMSDWSWRYTDQTHAQDVTVNKDGTTATVNNSRTNDKWLSGSSYAVNTAKGGADIH